MRNIDMSHLTESQQAEVALMQEYAGGPEMKASFTLVNLAEKILPLLLVNEHRLPPKAAAADALAYAHAMHHAGEAFMQTEFELWKAARKTEPAPAPSGDDILGAVDDNAQVGSEFDVDSDPVGGVVQEETISRDSAVADTELRTGRGEDVTPYKDTLPRVQAQDEFGTNFGHISLEASIGQDRETITEEELLQNMAAGGASQPG